MPSGRAGGAWTGWPEMARDDDRLPQGALDALARLRRLPDWNQLWFGEHGLLAPGRPDEPDKLQPAARETRRGSTERARRAASD